MDIFLYVRMCSVQAEYGVITFAPLQIGLLLVLFDPQNLLKTKSSLCSPHTLILLVLS